MAVDLYSRRVPHTFEEKQGALCDGVELGTGSGDVVEKLTWPLEEGREGAE